MIRGAKHIPVNSIQLKRIKNHPMQIDGNLLVFDSLETGLLRIYGQMDGPVCIQQLFSRFDATRNAVLVAEAVINSIWDKNAVFIHKLNCEHGHEALIQPMIEHILDFADYYRCYQLVRISAQEYNEWLPYAKDALADFKEIKSAYEYQSNR